MSEGYFFADQASQDALKQRQAYAQALLAAGQQDPGSSKYGGLANAGKEILGALLQNWSNKDAAKLSAEDKTKYADAITKMLGPGETKPGVFPTEAGDLNAMGTTNKGTLVDSLGADRSKAYADMLSGMQPNQGMQMLPGIMQQGFQRQDQISDEARQHAQMAQDKQMTPLTPEETQKLGLRGTFERDAFGNIKAVQESDVPSQEAQAWDMQKLKAQQAPQWANIAEDKRYHDIQQKNAEGAQLTDEDIKFMADQYLTGDTSVLAGLGYGNVGAQNRVRLRQGINQRAKDRGIPAEEVAARNAEFFGLKAGERTLGNRTANIEMATVEAQQMMPLALQASSKVDRTQYPTLNSVLLAAQKGVGDENVVRLASSTNALVNIYARAISPTGNPTVSDKDHAREILENAWSKGQYSAGVDQMAKEMAAARKSPAIVRQDMRRSVTGQEPAQPQQKRRKFNPATGELE